LMSTLSGFVSPIFPKPAAWYRSNSGDQSTNARSRGTKGLSSKNLDSFSSSPMLTKVNETPRASSSVLRLDHAFA
jgi:hypothetical protein